MKLIIYGDSHGSVGWPFGNTDLPPITNVLNHYYGPLLCYTLGQKKWEVIDISLYEDIEDGDVCVFCFGEIDCRCHIKNHVTDEITYQDIIDNIISNYLETIKLNIEKTGKSITTYIFNVVPPSRESDVNFIQPQFPFIGTDEERKSYVLYFNHKLKEKCLEFGFKFFDVYDKYVDSEGFLNRELSDPNVHIRDGIHILNFINENIRNIKNDV